MIIPNQTALTQIMTLPIILKKATINAPFSIRAKVSIENVEKVVKAPKKPTKIASFSKGSTSPRSTSNTVNIPIRKEPITFTANVPYGKSRPKREYTPLETR